MGAKADCERLWLAYDNIGIVEKEEEAAPKHPCQTHFMQNVGPFERGKS